MQVLSVIVTKWKEIVDRLAEIITTSRGDGSRATLRSAATEAALASVGGAGTRRGYEDNVKTMAESSMSNRIL
jgi:hypothetical protein